MITYRKLESSEAGKLVALVQASYGDSYPYSLLYDEELLAKKLADRSMISSAAFNDEDLIGHVGLHWEQAEHKTADSMTAIVLEAFQRQGILAKLTHLMGELMTGREIVGLHSYSVTTHTGSQKNGMERGSFETGFLIPEFPATMDAKGIQSDALGDRNPALTMYTPLVKPPSRLCYIIPDYVQITQDIYDRVGYEREFTQSAQHNPEGDSKIAEYKDKRKGVDRLELKKIGQDWQAITQAIRKSAQNSDCNTGYYIDIPMSQPAAIDVIQTLKSEDWCFGCILFERNEGDYLRMQYSKAKINREALQLLTPIAKELMSSVLDEQQSTF